MLLELIPSPRGYGEEVFVTIEKTWPQWLKCVPKYFKSKSTRFHALRAHCSRR